MHVFTREEDPFLADDALCLEPHIILLRCVLLNLNRQSGFLWTTTTAASGRDDPWVVEVIAPVGLRETYGLKDGDEVELEIPQATCSNMRRAVALARPWGPS